MNHLTATRIAALRLVAQRHSVDLWECAARVLGGSPDQMMQYRMRDIIETIEQGGSDGNRPNEQPIERFVKRLCARLNQH